MSKLLWGKVFFKDKLAGYLEETNRKTIVFTYEKSYIWDVNHPLSVTMPLREESYESVEGKLLPFFDNLVSEGWLQITQSLLLGKRNASKFELLLAFGFDCIGAVSIIAPSPLSLYNSLIDVTDSKQISILNSKASLPGMQPKIAVVEENGIFRPTRPNELSTHIAKFATEEHKDIIENEYLTTYAMQTLLEDDVTVDLTINEVIGINDRALIIKRFDRENNRRIHFEDFNQIFGQPSSNKYNGSYKEMSNFILNTQKCIHEENYKLYKRILVGFLLGNTDMHLKNFAMFNDGEKLTLTPSYDQVSSSLYHYKSSALEIRNSNNDIDNIDFLNLGKQFQIDKEHIYNAYKSIQDRIDITKQTVFDAKYGTHKLKNKIISSVVNRWDKVKFTD